MSELFLRKARPGDEAQIVTLLKEAAEYQGVAERFSLTASLARRTLTGPNCPAQCLLAFKDGQAVGIAVWFWSFRSFRGKLGLFLEDLYVRSDYRRQGTGKRIMAHLASIAAASNAFMEWMVFDWNFEAHEFYVRLGGAPKNEFTSFTFDGRNLTRLASMDEENKLVRAVF